MQERGERNSLCSLAWAEPRSLRVSGQHPQLSTSPGARSAPACSALCPWGLCECPAGTGLSCQAAPHVLGWLMCVPDLCALRGNRNHTCMCCRPCCPSEGHVPGSFVRRARGRAGAELTFLIWETTEWLGNSGYWSSSTREGSGSSFLPVSLILLKLDLLTTWLFSSLLEQSTGLPFSLLKLFLGRAVS